MAAPALSPTVLPSEPELRSFAAAAAQLLIERHPRNEGSRSVSRRAGVGLQHLDHRDYAPGDEVRHIDWRQTARRRRPTLRRFEAESMSDWTLLIDASSSMATHGAAKWQAAARVAAAMSYALLHLGQRVSVLAFGERVLTECHPGRGQRHYADIARLLTALRPSQAAERSELGVCARHLRGDASVLTLSDFLAHDAMSHDLGAVRERCKGLHVIQLTDARDMRLPATGDVDLVDVETGKRMHAFAGDSANACAVAQRAAMTARLRGFCARNAAVFTEWDIAQPWQRALLGHLVQARSN